MNSSEKAHEKAYEILRQRLIGGIYAPGAQLKEEPLARELGTSRTPIRSALKRLIQEGLATADAGQGAHVPEWGDSDIEETFGLRLMLEPYAASLAAVRGGDEMVKLLSASNAQMRDAIKRRNINGIQMANHAFHETLLNFCGSPRLRMILQTMIDIPIIVRSFYLSDEDDLANSLRHHEELTRAAEIGDGGLAEDVMRLHLRLSHSRFVRNRIEYRKLGSDNDKGHVKADVAVGLGKRARKPK